MDFIYAAGPALVAFMFAFLAVNTNQKKNPMLRLMYTGFALAALLVFVNMAQIAAVYGETIPDVETTTYLYNATGSLMNSTTAIHFTNTSPITNTDYDMLWLVVSYAIWLFFVYIVLQILARAVETGFQAFTKRKGGFDEIG